MFETAFNMRVLDDPFAHDLSNYTTVSTQIVLINISTMSLGKNTKSVKLATKIVQQALLIKCVLFNEVHEHRRGGRPWHEALLADWQDQAQWIDWRVK